MNFVNSNKPNVSFPENVADVSASKFDYIADLFASNVNFDSVDKETSFPVYVYYKNNKPIAWWDCELVRGFDAQIEA